MKLGNVMKLSKGNLISIEDDKEYIIAGVQNYGAGILNKRKVKGFELNMKKYQLIKPNQLMWCKVDTKNGAFGITKSEHTNSLASTNMALADIDINKCHPEFIEYLFRISYFYEIITKASSGSTNRKYLTPTQLFENIEIPDFNKDEQLKWLVKVDSIINSGISNELTYELTLVKKLRKQFLQEAVQGKLVPQNKKDEPASELLKKIKTEKQKLIAENKLKKEKELPPIKPEEISFKINDNWVLCRLGNISTLITDGKHGDALAQANSGYYFLSAKDVKNGKLQYDNARQITYEDFFETHRRTNLEAGDLCIVNTGATIGKTALVEDSELTPKTTFQKSVAVIKVLKQFTNMKYVEYFMINETPKLLKTSKGSAINNLLLGDMKNVLFPMPPLAEQNRIVQKLDELMQYCNELEVSIKQSELQNKKLLQQVLREALRKETVEV